MFDSFKHLWPTNEEELESPFYVLSPSVDNLENLEW